MTASSDSSPTPAARPRWRRLFFIGAVLCAVGALNVYFFPLVAHLFSEKTPMTNSEEYLLAHGVVAGRTNELRVNGVLLRFPPAFLPQPYSEGRPVRGQADAVTTHLDLGAWFVPEQKARSEYLALVRIELHAQGSEDIERNRRQFRQTDWKRVIERPELGLREYISERDLGGWGYRTYTPLDQTRVTPLGGPITYKCAGPPGAEPELCRAYFMHPQGLYVGYYLSRRLLPRWSEVHAEVLKTVNSFIVDKGNK